MQVLVLRIGIENKLPVGPENDAAVSGDAAAANYGFSGFVVSG